MKNRIGKITVILLIAIMLFAAIVTVTSREAKAATGKAHTISVHKGMGFTTVGDVYLIISPVASCDMYGSAGTVQTTIGSAAIEFTADGQYTDEALATIPALAGNTEWEVTFYENGTPTAGDTPIVGPILYDTETGKFYTDTNLNKRGSAYVQIKYR